MTGGGDLAAQQVPGHLGTRTNPDEQGGALFGVEVDSRLFDTMLPLVPPSSDPVGLIESSYSVLDRHAMSRAGNEARG